ncbi:kinase-like domain-containing protein [Linnemannia elongata]|nr:kinase-like domain-containing protein [Linnemannia elongata]
MSSSKPTSNTKTPAVKGSKALSQGQGRQEQQMANNSPSAAESATTATTVSQVDMANVPIPDVARDQSGFLHPYSEYVHDGRTYTVEAFVAAGSFGSVYAVRSERQLFAVKAQLGGNLYKDSIFKGEVTTVYHLGAHKNLIKSFGAFVHRDHLCLRFEWAPFTLRRRIREGLTLSKVKAITKGLGEGLAYIHSENVIHRDVKESNVLFTGAGLNPLIADFGLSVCLKQSTDKASRRCGTERNWAPELRRDEPYDNKVDMFAFGVILLRMLERVITGGTQDFEVGKEEGLDLAARLTEDLPTTRYSAVQALMHPFLATTVERQPTEGKGAHERQPSVNSSCTTEGQSEVQSKAVDDTAGQREEMRERMEVWVNAQGSMTRGGSLPADGVAVKDASTLPLFRIYSSVP